MLVLVVSSLADGHAPFVLRELNRRRGVQAELLDLARFPAGLSLSAAYDGGHADFRFVVPGGESVALGQVGAVWWRRPQPFGPPPGVTDHAALRFARSEAATAFAGVWQCLDATWVNRPEADLRAGHKPWQLRVAQAVGLEIPRTLMTSDPEAARIFCASVGKAVYKQFAALPESWRETRIVDEAALSRMHLVAHAPVIFQEYVEADAELRVTVIGDRVFPAAVNLREAVYPADVRFNLALTHAVSDLPTEVADRLRVLVRNLGLTYAAIDLRRTLDGRHVFLEANPAGQFLYIEQMTGQPITAALADALTAPAQEVTARIAA